mgnify:CR=1 FL=1
MSITNPIRKALIDRTPTFGSWLQIGPYPALAEILANAGYDWLGVDCEHSEIDVEGFTALARGMYGRGALPLARVRENDTLAIRQMLDAGAQGIIVPLVNSAEEAKEAVAAAKYPPQGVRGFCFSRMNEYGTKFDEYAANANDNIAVVVMIESKQAVENIDEILAVDGVDGVFIGPYDMSGSYGLIGQTSHPIIKEACAEVVAACQRHGKAAGLHLVKPDVDSIAKTIADGFTFIALGVDMVFLQQAAGAALTTARKTVASL